MSQFEYAVSLADARTPNDMAAVAKAFEAGQNKENQRIKSGLDDIYSSHDDPYVILFKLRKIINND